MSPRVRIVLTADYELFLGRNFACPDEVLFGPTERLRVLCDQLEVPLTLFADVCSVWAHRDHGLLDYAERFEEQLRDTIRAGHDVQLHLHPHWLFASPHGTQWRVDPDRMYLHEMGFGDGALSATTTIKRGVSYLHDLLRPVHQPYRCLAFRSAALALQPRERELIAALLNAGIQIESSVVKGVFTRMDTVTLDYRRVPSLPNWHLSPDGGLASAATEGLLEVPIATFRARLPTRLRFLARRVRSLRQVRGTGISRASRQTRLANLMTLVRGNLRYLWLDSWFVLSFDTKGLNVEMLTEGLFDYLERHSGHDVALSIISHPKLMFQEQLDMMSEFVEHTKRELGSAVEWTKYGALVDATN